MSQHQPQLYFDKRYRKIVLITNTERDSDAYIDECENQVRRWLKQIEKDFGYKQRIQAFAMLKSVFVGEDLLLRDVCSRNMKRIKDVCNSIYGDMSR
jgi:DNA polymerase elongation subunit (family B)